MDTIIKPPTSFWVIGISAFLWNIAELYITGYQMDILQNNTTPEEFEQLEAVPVWYGIIFTIALLSETIGVLLLLSRRKIAIYLFAVSIAALFFTELYWVFAIDVDNISIILSYVVPILVIGVAIFLYFYSKRAGKKGWLK